MARQMKSKKLSIIAWTAFPFLHTNAMLYILRQGEDDEDDDWWSLNQGWFRDPQ